jgi:hypothetical protein
MAAPDKIYACFGVFGLIQATEIRATSRDIEYTRTDAFIEKVYDYLKNYAFVDDDKKIHLPTLLHDFLKDSRNF